MFFASFCIRTKTSPLDNLSFGRYNVMDVMHYFRFYNKCWGQVMNLAPTFIIEPFSLSRQSGSAGGVSFFLFSQQGIGRYLKCYAAHTKGGFDPDAAESGKHQQQIPHLLHRRAEGGGECQVSRKSGDLCGFQRIAPRAKLSRTGADRNGDCLE